MNCAIRWAIPLLFGVSCCPAQFCGRNDIQGQYGFQLAGTATITEKETPMAAVGRLAFDGSGKISGVSSVNFKGLFLGNPTTGSYEFRDADCTLTFQLQDDSGAFQHFTGASKPGGATIEVHQTDPGIGGRGVLQKVAETCNASGFNGSYSFVLSGAATPLATGRAPGSVASARGLVEADGAGNLAVTVSKTRTAGTYKVDSDCMVQMEFPLATSESNASVKLRGVLVNGGREVLAVETDPAQTASARFTSVPASSTPRQ